MSLVAATGGREVWWVVGSRKGLEKGEIRKGKKENVTSRFQKSGEKKKIRWWRVSKSNRAFILV